MRYKEDKMQFFRFLLYYMYLDIASPNHATAVYLALGTFMNNDFSLPMLIFRMLIFSLLPKKQQLFIEISKIPFCRA